MILGYTLQVIVLWVVRKQSYDAVNIVFRKLQLLSAALYSLGHGTNDAQKTMGIITGVLVTSGHLRSFLVPIWVVLAAHAMAAKANIGTASMDRRLFVFMNTSPVFRPWPDAPWPSFSASTAG